MSTAPHLTPISEVLPIQRRDFSLADTTILNPNASNPLLDGEWLQLDSNYAMARGSGDAAVPSWVVFAERGRYDTQPIGKVPMLFLGPFEAESDIMLVTGIGVGDPLMVSDVTISSLTRRGLKKATAGNLVVGYCSRIVGSGATTKLRFVSYGPNGIL